MNYFVFFSVIHEATRYTRYQRYDGDKELIIFTNYIAN